MQRKNRITLLGNMFMTVLALILVLCASAATAGPNPKYVFLFIGDGMGIAQVHSAEIYLSSIADPGGTPARTKLTMSTFPVTGMITTFGHNSYIPDSADAGTALACGKKTNSGIISMDPTGTVPYKSIATLAMEKDMKVGIVSSASIDHATPAVFYANQPSRNKYYEIAMTMAHSRFNYFGGGGIKYPTGAKGDQPSVLDAASANGFRVAKNRVEFENLVPGKKAIAYNAVLDEEKALFFALDRKRQNPLDHISLAEFTRKGIQLLNNRSKGFFMMVEGGKIDWSCHANDARATIEEVIAFNEAIDEAAKFYKANPYDTLIVVTADHETGGMSLGFAGTRYETRFEVLQHQNKSHLEFGKLVKAYKANGASHVDIDPEMKQMIQDSFGLSYDHLSDYEKQQLEDAYDRSMGGPVVYGAKKDYLLYGGHDPLTVTLTRILNQHAGIGWTTYSHTGLPVPVFAMGVGAQQFDGFYDNTDIARKLATAMRLHLNN
jgi:alkaline phosphatase